MVANSRLKKYIHKDTKGRERTISNLYRDENTGTFYARVYHLSSVKTRTLGTDNFQLAKSRLFDAIKSITGEVKKVERKIEVKKYDPTLRKRVVFKEVKK